MVYNYFYSAIYVLNYDNDSKTKMNIYSVFCHSTTKLDTDTRDNTWCGAGDLAGTVRARGGGVSSPAGRAARSGVENIKLNWENIIRNLDTKQNC